MTRLQIPESASPSTLACPPAPIPTTGRSRGSLRLHRLPLATLALWLILTTSFGGPRIHAAALPDALADRIAARDYGSALAGLDSVLTSGELLPQDRTLALLMRALCLKGLDRPGDGLGGFQASRAVYPDIEDYLARLEGDCLEALGRHDEAVACYDGLAGRFPGYRFRDEVRLKAARIAERTGRAESAARRYREIAQSASDADDVAEGLFGLASAQVVLKQPSAAAENLRLLVHGHPANRWAPKALPLLGDPKTAGAWYDVGQVRFHQGQWAEAVTAFRTVAGRFPGDSRVGLATFWEGRAHFSAKAYAPALSAFTAAYRRYHIADALFYMGRCAVRADDDRVGSDRLLEFSRKYPANANADDALWYAAWSLERLGDFGGARKAFLHLSSAYPASRNVEQARFRACLVLYSAGRHREAVRALQVLGDTSHGYLKDQAYYWVGKCQDRLGDRESAGRYYARAASSFPVSYYAARAVLALSDQQKANLALQTLATAGSPSDDEGSGGGPPLPGVGARKADLLARIGLYQEAAGELAPVERATGDLPALRAILWRYERVRAYDRALRLAARIVDLEQRAGARISGEVIRRLYPTYYADLIRKPAADNGVEPALVLAIIRQESAFDPGSISSAGARGLMQIMPTTGAAWAEGMGIRNFTVESLDDPAVSIRYGCREIASYLPQFSNDLRGLALALSSYNAGLDVAQRWDRNLSRDVDELVETVPYHETRGYIKSVVRNYEVYKLLLRKREGVDPSGTR